MQVSRRKTSLILWAALLTLFSIPNIARAGDDDDADDDYDVKARVVRISLIGGEVNLKREGNQDWESLRLNYPLVEGDTVATENDSRLEIQIDARNFVRVPANSTLRIVTLREEGIALSVVEGTATVRLAKFDRTHEYFEIDAPRTTMAAEKAGSYRIDVPRDGRVRLTVRDGGSARIYSDTSGFTLRDGRSAELVVSGENMGDWEFSAAARDAIDDWVTEREQHLAQRLKYDVKYYDEYVWGAEDLDAYGDWSYADDYGWIWRPHTRTISTFTDWAPYRYGHWSWCPPYGWTWVGHEPWGWAPYHYGRWVYYNGFWAWCPRSQFYRHRSWWRPALVAFVFDIHFGNDVCWYPLSYYQRDPHSRHYRHDHRDGRDDRHDRPGYGGPGGRRDGHDDGPWRGVTRLPRGDFGNPGRRGRPVEETVARNVVDRDPEVVTVPGRTGGTAENIPSGRGREGDNSDRPVRRPHRDIPDRPTGAAERRPGPALDEDLRRTRIFRGREPKPESSQPANPAGTPRTETQPTGAVNRPERPASTDQPRDGRPGRFERPNRTEGDNRRNDGGNERAPRNAPDAGNTPAPPTEQPAATSTPAPEPRTERPAAPERPQPQPRFEPREPRPERGDRPERSDRPERRPERRSEEPSQPRSEERPARPDPPRIETPRPERTEQPRTESPRTESPRPERHPEPRSEPPRSENRPSRPDPPPRSESPRSESPRSEPPRSSPPPSRPDPPARVESPKSESPRPSPHKPDNPVL